MVWGSDLFNGGGGSSLTRARLGFRGIDSLWIPCGLTNELANSFKSTDICDWKRKRERDVSFTFLLWQVKWLNVDRTISVNQVCVRHVYHNSQPLKWDAKLIWLYQVLWTLIFCENRPIWRKIPKYPKILISMSNRHSNFCKLWTCIKEKKRKHPNH